MKFEFIFLSTYALQVLSLQCYLQKPKQPYNFRVFADVKERVSTDSVPKWAAGGLVSDFVNALIGYKPLFKMMKPMARNVLISNAEKKGIAWFNRASYLQSKQKALDMLLREIENEKIIYPDYYKNDFHAYDGGNLNWLAAYECEQATLSMQLRVYPKESITAIQAHSRLRNSIYSAIKSFRDQHYPESESLVNILDVGCSIGLSTFSLADAFPCAAVTGLDLSPYFLAVAKYRQQEIMKKEHQGIADLTPSYPGFSFTSDVSRVKWLHAAAENTQLPTSEYDLINLGFVCHELPQKPIREILAEMFRIQKPGGVIALTDNDPQSEVIQNLPPFLFVLMKSTEPFSDQYYSFNLEDALRQVGYTDVITCATDPRHRTIIGYKPKTEE